MFMGLVCLLMKKLRGYVRCRGLISQTYDILDPLFGLHMTKSSPERKHIPTMSADPS